MDVVLAGQRSVTWFLTGLIWYVQLVHYPSFAGWARDAFPAQHAAHSRRTGFIVAPAMVLELMLSARCLWAPIPAFPREWAAFGFALVVAIWASTFWVMIPLHGRLSRGFDGAAVQALVRWNWLRTVAWSLRGLIVA